MRQWGKSALRQLALDVLIMAAIGEMPDTFWLSDSRIKRACDALDWSPPDARDWAHREIERLGYNVS